MEKLSEKWNEEKKAGKKSDNNSSSESNNKSFSEDKENISKEVREQFPKLGHEDGFVWRDNVFHRKEKEERFHRKEGRGSRDEDEGDELELAFVARRNNKTMCHQVVAYIINIK